MIIAIRAGAFYALIVFFLIGFIFGTIRVLLLAPRLGERSEPSAWKHPLCLPQVGLSPVGASIGSVWRARSLPDHWKH